ncbi:nitrate- and nitrite sensing domain-containing protein [Nocardia sp. NPDC059246]|uniref:sensor histidine kinase n=1 Tax=Nocardia sp. NPDC059246 TaxID=3346789 RepID=UPI0036BC4A10
MAIALIPSIALLAGGTAAVGYPVAHALRDKGWADEVVRSVPVVVDVSAALGQEFGLTLLRVGGKSVSPTDLTRTRGLVDKQMPAVIDSLKSLSRIHSSVLDEAAPALSDGVQRLTVLRAEVDAGKSSIDEVYSLYARMDGLSAALIEQLARAAPGVDDAIAELNSAGLYRARGALSMVHSLAAAAIDNNGLAPGYWREFARQTDRYHGTVANLGPTLPPEGQRMLADMISSQSWQQLTGIEEAIIAHGPSPSDDEAVSSQTAGHRTSASLAVDPAVWAAASADVKARLLQLWRTSFAAIHQLASATASHTLRNSIWEGAVGLLIAALVALTSIALSNQVSRRLKRLRHETLAMSDVQLPRIMTMIRANAAADVQSEVTPLDFGSDEIGQVADAFNRSQGAAVSAAITEAKTREAVNAVFLNIAHRSQLIMHRQLEILDTAESRQEDPALLDVFFQLDHLATRERRNAENLIILGGERPGRRWRNPVPLEEIVRSAIAETQDYRRVRATRMPEVRVIGTVVADLIHLLAELIDNATAFSPAESRVETSASAVGKGAVVEIVDQGLGMTSADLERANDMLSDPPDFGVLQLSSDSRVGLLVVALLAARNEIKVRLAESDYGGVRVVVLIPQSLLDTEDSEPDSANVTTAPQIPRHRAVEPPVPAALTSPPPTAAELSPARSALPQIDWKAPDLPENDRNAGGYATAPDFNSSPPIADGRPALPKRRKQENLAPELARAAVPDPSPEPAPQFDRSPERARDLMRAIENGTRQGRRAHSVVDLHSTDEL